MAFRCPLMAARRLIIVLLALMAISTVAAILAPPIEERSAETSTETTSTSVDDGEEQAVGALLEKRIDAGGRPERIDAVVGDRLSLTVTSPTPTNVQVPALGLIAFADRGTPARFDFALREEARYRVELDDGAAVATIEVAAAPGRPGS